MNQAIFSGKDHARYRLAAIVSVNIRENSNRVTRDLDRAKEALKLLDPEGADIWASLHCRKP